MGLLRVIAIDADEMERIYRDYLIKDFNEDRVRPWENISDLKGKGQYIAYGAYDPEEEGLIALNEKAKEGEAKEKLMGYAFFAGDISDAGKILLMDYFHIEKDVREKGNGYRFLSRLRRKMGAGDMIFAQLEAPGKAKDQGCKEDRNRQIAFYEKVGFSNTGVMAKINDASYLIYVLGKQRMVKESVRQVMQAIYQMLYPADFVADKITVI